MSWRDLVSTAAGAVRSHRLRSVLTTLGILIGITAVILTVGFGAGAQAQVRDQINELGTNVLVISPGSQTSSSGTRGGFGTASTLTESDATALASKTAAPDVVAVAPISTSSAELLNGSTNWTTTLTGTTPAWQTVRSRKLLLGRFIDAHDESTAARVVVLGSDTAQELFSTTNAVGRTVSDDGVQLQVVGVLSELSSSDVANNNDLAIVPMSTYAERLVGGTTRTSVSSIYVKASSSSTLSAAYQEVDTVLANAHRITKSANADYSIATQQSILAAATSVNSTLTVMLAGIAVISLLVGGIGVMNIMLVSVSERVHEIGLRKALGARRRSIRRQFLVEASMLGFAGGVLGVGAGLAVAVIVPHFTTSRVIVSLPAALGAIAVALAIGIAFGVYPATRAARLAPIDALRND
jgi:putative ABC transport system permease protein